MKQNRRYSGNVHLRRLMGTNVFADGTKGTYICLQTRIIARALSLSRSAYPIQQFVDIPGIPSAPLPIPLTPLLGREQALHDTCTRLLRPEVRLLTLAGMPGVGKTRLAQSVAAQAQNAFKQGVCFVSLANNNDTTQVLPTIAYTVLGLTTHETTSALEQLKEYLHKQSLLLVLDTFEHVLPAAPLLVELLTSCPQLKLLVTSRAALSVQGEYEFSVSPLALPDLHESSSSQYLAQIPSVALFMQRLEALKPEMAITEHNAALIAKICVQLEGIPLALELAATRCKLLSIQELAAFLDQGLEVLPKILSGGKHDLPTRQQSLNNTIAWSYHLLSHDEQTLFRRLCIFEGPFSLIEARAVALAPGEPGLSMLIMDGCASLINQSLLQQHEETVHGPRLSISKMIRAYGLEQLAEAGELEVCQKAYAAYKRVTSEYSTLQPIAALPEKLTSREIEVLRLLAMGLSNNQIAKRLVLSPFTVNRHAQSIYGKLGVNSRCAATRLALEHHLL